MLPSNQWSEKQFNAWKASMPSQTPSNRQEVWLPASTCRALGGEGSHGYGGRPVVSLLEKQFKAWKRSPPSQEVSSVHAPERSPRSACVVRETTTHAPDTHS